MAFNLVPLKTYIDCDFRGMSFASSAEEKSWWLEIERTRQVETAVMAG
jgi:hypothetical protein